MATPQNESMDITEAELSVEQRSRDTKRIYDADNEYQIASDPKRPNECNAEEKTTKIVAVAFIRIMHTTDLIKLVIDV